MPSTYTNNLGIQKPANGEQSGTWGETVNANSDILDNAINGVLALTLSGTSSTLTTANGVASNGQYKVLVLGGSPSGTHTITIDPNTAQKLYFVNNLTAQSVVITQGSGGSVTLVTNSSAVIYADGAGAAAKVTNITNSLSMSATKITGGSITGITDLAIADGGTGSSTAAGALINFGLTATAAEINVLDGITATTAELNILDGVTATTAELNILDGVTATTAEINFVDGVTSNIQTQLNAKQASLGFTPVQQGGGGGQGSNKLYMGWTGAGVSIQVDDNNGFGNLAFENAVSSSNSALVKGALNASGGAPIFGVRAWVNFFANGGTITVRASGNVSSVTFVSTGVWQVNFTTALGGDNYSATASAQRSGGSDVFVSLTSVGTSSIRVQAFDQFAGRINTIDYMCLTVVR